MTDLTMSQFASKDDLLAAQAARIAELEGSVTHLENVYGAAIRKVVELEQGKCLHQIAEPAAPVEKQIKDAIDALVMAAFTEGGCSEHRMSEARIQTELRKKELCTLIAATQPAAQGMEALPMQASEGVEDVAVMEHPEWMLVHKETGAQKPLDSQWTVRAAQPAAQGAATTGYIAPKGRYVPPVLFSPYTGEPRDARDIASDPRGILIVPPGAALAAQAKQGGAA